MKDLDQPSRATLRKYGVRFGAYHIYVPALLKPAARALASLLWAQKLDNVDLSALSGAQHLAGSGRTSFPIDKLLDRDAYRVLGYRQCGERAVRVDILERLADLIRPALAWREGSPSQKPAGAFDGRGFVVTQAMTSLTGSAGEDFASILRALGYRMERRPAPPKPAAIEATPVETAPLDVAAPEASSPEAVLPESAATDTSGLEPVAAAETTDTADITNDVPPAVEATALSSATLLPNVAFSPASHEHEAAAVEANPIDVLPDPAASTENPAPEAPAPEARASEAPASETPVSEPPQVEASAEIATESAAVGDAAPADAPAAGATVPDAAAAPEMVDVWRPGGRSEERRPRHDRSRHRHQGSPDRPQEGAQPVAATGEANDGARRERHGRGRRDRGNDFRKPRSDAPPVEAAAAPAAEAAPVREPRDDKGRPSRERFADKGRDRDKDRDKGKFGGGRDKGGRDKGGRDKRDGGPSHRQFATSAPPRERERPVDPNSPFAKLAALKEQLTANRKDR
jgi:ATP-dependent RNA helicase SUPV3L1/SUV3